MFPDSPKAELAELMESIWQNGQQEQAVIHEARILDGKNRAAACEALGTTLRTTILPSGMDPVAFVMQRNLLRRHLTTSQRAAIAAELRALFAGNLLRRFSSRTLAFMNESA